MKKFTAILLSSTLLLSSNIHSFAAEKLEKSEKWSVNKPMGVFKDVKINVDQGTWMNVDLSPDGKSIIFDLLGDIYIMPSSGGQAKALTHDIAWQMQPKFSPDGKTIAFTSDQGGGDNIWVMDVDGKNARAISTETFHLLNSPAWSPDGNYIVARKHFTSGRSLGAGEIWIYHKNGGRGMVLTKRPNDQKDLGEPAFSPDGRYVYFSQDATPGKRFHYSKDSEKGIYKIKRYDRQTGDWKIIISGMGGAIRPTPSPDGKKIAYIRRDDFQTSLYLYDLKSGSHRKLNGELDRDMQETWAIHGVYPTMTWSKNNKELIFWAGGKIKRLNVKSKKVSDIPFSVKTTKKIQEAVRFEQDLAGTDMPVKMLRNAQVSPDGKMVIFEALGYLYKRKLPDGKPVRITKQMDHFELYPQFSRDGKKITYVTWDDQKQGRVRVINSRNGRGKDIVSGTGKYVEPVFAPDGKTVVFRKIWGGSIMPQTWGLNAGIYKLSSNGGTPELITKSGRFPQFGGRSDRIYLMGSGKNKSTFFSYDLKEKKQKTLYSSKYAGEYKISPDGKYLAFKERFKVFITPFVETGHEISISPKDKKFPIKQLSVRAGEGISWSAKGNRIYWTLGPEFYSAKLDGIFDIKSKEKDFKIKNGQNISFTAKRDVPKGMVAFTGGQVITMEGDRVIKAGVVIVKNNKIIAVGKTGDVTIPKDAKIIDITGKTLMPGIIDAHAHGAQGSSEIIPEQNWKNYAGLTFGVTSIHDPSNDTSTVFTASEMAKVGKIVAPRIFSTGTILYGAYGAGYTAHVDSLEDAKFHLKRLKKVGAFSVKSYNQPRRDQRQQIIQAARELKMMVVPEGGSLLQHNLTMIADGHTTIEHSIPPAKIYADIEQLWHASKTAYTPTLVVAYGGIWGENYWYDKTEVWKHPRLSKYVPDFVLNPRSMRRPKAPEHHYNHKDIAKVAKKLNDLGVNTNVGGHGQREGLGAHWDIWMFAQGGMTNLNALKTGTINPARSLGLAKDIGSLKVGKLADMIVIDGNPLKDIRISDRVIYTMINGRLYNAKTMNEVGNYNKKRKAFFFEK